jgi:arginyl-tRNA synthetase
VCTYLFELAQQFNSFYHKAPILQAERESQRQLRLQLTEAVAGTIQHGLKVLGIETVEKM